jgi:serine/threonine-protein kinase RsbT
MVLLRQRTFDIRTSEDVVAVRQAVRWWAAEIGYRPLDQTKLMTATSEIARNTLRYGGGGTLQLEALEEGFKRALRLTFRDEGPGIADLEQALQAGFSTGGGLGLGLSGTRRLVHEFHIESSAQGGTIVILTHWAAIGKH